MSQKEGCAGLMKALILRGKKEWMRTERQRIANRPEEDVIRAAFVRDKIQRTGTSIQQDDTKLAIQIGEGIRAVPVIQAGDPLGRRGQLYGKDRGVETEYRVIADVDRSRDEHRNTPPFRC